MEEEGLLGEARGIFEAEPKLIHLPFHGRAVFAGDTHGDLDATERILSRFLGGAYILVFLGDYVDRGEFSRENITYLLRKKLEHPKDLILLAGNHEGYMLKPFSPSDFWETLSLEEREAYGSLFSRLPLAVTSSNGILAVHGGVPDLDHLGEINRIESGDDQWNRIVWGDFVERDGEILGDWGGRPQFGRGYFERVLDRYQRRVLIRSHQPYAPLYMFKKRCVTIFTSYSYVPDRHVAIVDLEKEISSTGDLVVERI